MHWIAFLVFGLIALFWLTHGTRVIYGATQLPRLEKTGIARDEFCPRISILFAARDEEEKLAAALETLIALDYPNLEIVAVDDRSEDSTPQILAAFVARDARVRMVRIDELPAGWLGKPHALQRGYEAASGEWLLFTDADVQFHAESLRRAVSIVEERKLDHLTLMCAVQMHGFWEKMLITFFGLGFHVATNPNNVGNPRSKSYVGIGAFQLVRRTAYEESGMHRRLALEVVDDMKLAKNIKQAGFRSCVGVAQKHVSVRWHAGAGNIVRGVTKNFFAAASYSLGVVAAQSLGIFCTNILPFAALPFLHGWPLAFDAYAVAAALGFHAGVAVVMRVSPLYALTNPLGAILFTYMLLRSTVVTMWQGGIVWRGTFYSLEELRRG
ncbi:MAG TPA: glycosyltransferase family 2 protein [Candidatus Dormibacteraeota bacterium]|nr:glycosyltransferase family 2 protein [Candidatus Dormibacteraeota bacterium]